MTTEVSLRQKFEERAIEDLPRIITKARNAGADAAIKMFEAALVSAYNAGVEASVASVPTNWCDSLLTGPEGITIPATCPHIEGLLAGVGERIKALKIPVSQ